MKIILSFAFIAILNAVIFAAAPTLDWSGEINYIFDGLNPETGDPTTQFTYKVKYMDSDNNPPFAYYPRVHILKKNSGGLYNEYINSPFIMSAVDTSDNSYADGKKYQYQLTLQAGEYKYYFDAFDSTNQRATGSPVSDIFRPVVSSETVTAKMELNKDLLDTSSSLALPIIITVPPSTSNNRELFIYNALGDLVMSFAPANQINIWNGRDKDSRRVPPGVYFIAYQIDNAPQDKKKVLILK